MADFDRIKERGERLRKRMQDSISPERAWDTLHTRNSPPKKYPRPNFRTNPGYGSRTFDRNGGNDDLDEDDDFYDYLTDEEDKKKEESKTKQHDVDDEEYRKKLQDLERQRRLEEARKKINEDAKNNLMIHQMSKMRVSDPFAKQPDPPLVLQLYLRIDKATYLNPRDIAFVNEAEDKKLSEHNVFRNTFVQFKDFPKGNTQKTPIVWSTNNPVFNYKAYFPIIVRADIFQLLSKFFFFFEIWDQVTPDKHS